MDSPPGFPPSVSGVSRRWLYAVAGLGTLVLEFHGAVLTGLSPATDAAMDLPFLPAQHAVAQALGAYTVGDFAVYERLLLQLPLQAAGTPFQQRVWRALQEIPVGIVRSYGGLADTLHSAPRAVGQACRKNPIAILIPCHRVVAKQGLGGYAGKRTGPELAYKAFLLRHEGVFHALD